MQKQPLILSNKTIDEWLVALGEDIRSIRLRQNLDQRTLAERSDVSLSALRNLETGQGASLTTLIKVIRSLGKTDWLEALSPIITVSPLQALKSRPVRMRASKPRAASRALRRAVSRGPKGKQ